MEDNTIKQVGLWRTSATVGAFFSLFVLLWAHFLGFENYKHVIACIVVSIFFTSAVIWWFWALSKMVFFSTVMEKTMENFNVIQKELSEIKKNLR